MCLCAAPARAQSNDAQTDEQGALTQPVLAIGAFGLGAVSAACVTPAVINITHAVEGEPAPSGPILVSSICAAVQVSGGLAYALRDGPGWQRTVGVVSTALGALSLGAAIAGALPPSVEVAGARLHMAPWTAWARPGEPAWGLSLSVR